ncbi:MAG TPA: secretion system protein E [Methanomicrobia archaeon]|nr:secretion system protein E [Methanomicrobia archaeon]
MRLTAAKGTQHAKGEVRTGGAVAKKQLLHALSESKRIEEAEKLQERLLTRIQTQLNKTEAKAEADERAKLQAEEQEAVATLERIRAKKSAAEVALRAAIAALKGETVEPNPGETPVPDPVTVAPGDGVAGGASPFASYLAAGGARENAEAMGDLETYPVNEPWAYVHITATTPPIYAVHEVELSEGERELLKEIKTYLYETLDVSLTTLQEPVVFLRERVDRVLQEFGVNGSITQDNMDKLMYYVTRDFIGYGKLDPLIRDKMAEDISADGPEIPLFVFHRNYGSIETNIIFNREDLDALIYRLSQRSGRHISLARPLLDASLPTKDRLQLSIGSEVTTRGSTFTIRKFRETPFTPINLVEYGTFSMEMMAYFWLAVENGANILIAGGTASGKTTVLNAIAMFIPPESKIVSIEDTREINLLHQNWIPAVTRQVEEGGYAIEMYDLLRTALRQRPEYVLVGEVRGVEAHTLFQAMATGHITLSTIHAESATTVVKRLTKHPIDVPLMLLDSLDIIAIQRQVKVGERHVRRCTKIIEVTGIDFEEEMLKTNELFTWRPDEFEFTGESRVFVKIMEKLNLSEEQLVEEFSRRKRILDAMSARGMDDFQSLNRVLLDYCIDPAGTEQRVVPEEREREVQ